MNRPHRGRSHPTRPSTALDDNDDDDDDVVLIREYAVDINDKPYDPLHNLSWSQNGSQTQHDDLTMNERVAKKPRCMEARRAGRGGQQRQDRMIWKMDDHHYQQQQQKQADPRLEQQSEGHQEHAPLSSNGLAGSRSGSSPRSSDTAGSLSGSNPFADLEALIEKQESDEQFQKQREQKRQQVLPPTESISIHDTMSAAIDADDGEKIIDEEHLDDSELRSARLDTERANHQVSQHWDFSTASSPWSKPIDRSRSWSKNPSPTVLLQLEVSQNGKSTTRLKQASAALPDAHPATRMALGCGDTDAAVPRPLGSAAQPKRHAAVEAERSQNSVVIPGIDQQTYQDPIESNRPLSSMNLLNISRRMAAKHTHLGGTDSSNNRPTSARTTHRTVAPANSIVGSRPMHWGVATDPTAVRKRHADPTFAIASRQERKQRLTAAVSGLGSRRRPNNRSSGSFVPGSVHRSQQPVAEVPGSGPTVSLVKSALLSSFAPSFVTSRGSMNRNAGDDDVLENLESYPNLNIAGTPWMSPPNQRPSSAHVLGSTVPRVAAMSSSLSMTTRTTSAAATAAASVGGGSPSRLGRTKSKSSSMAIGPLVKRLKTLRDAERGDTIRLCSGQYPLTAATTVQSHDDDLSSCGSWPSLLLDHHDPRYRARSWMDVTILSHAIMWIGSHHGTHISSGSGGSSSNISSSSYHANTDQARFTFVAYIHHFQSQHHPKAATCVVGTDDNGPPYIRDTPNNNDKDGIGGLSYISFTHDTVRIHDIQATQQLRIYNPIILTVPDLDHGASRTLVDGNVLTPEQITCHIVCTQLCEPYPHHILPAHPETTTILATLLKDKT